MASKLVRRAAIAAGAIAAVVLVLLAVVHLPFVRARVLERTRAYAARELGLVVDATALHYNIPARSIELRNVSIASAGGEPMLVRADALRIVLEPRMFRGIFAVHRLELARPRVTLVRHADGSMNLPPSNAGASASSSPLRLGVIEIRQLTLALDDEVTGRHATAGPLDLVVDTTRANTSPGAFGPAPFALRLGTPGTTARTVSGTLAGRLGFDGARLTAAALHADTPAARLSLDGWLDVIAAKPRLDVRSRINLDLPHVERLAGAPRPSLGGSAVATLTAVGPMLDPSVEVRVEGDELRFRSLKGLRLKAESTMAGGRVTIRGLNLSSDLGIVEANGAIGLSDQSGNDARLVARWQRLDLGRALEAAGVELPVRLATSSEGQLTMHVGSTDLASFQAEWLSSLSANAETRLTAAAAGGIDGQARLMLRDGAWSLKHDVAVRDAGATLAGTLSGRLRPGVMASTLGGRSDVRIEDLGEAANVLATAGISLPPQLVKGASGVLDGGVVLGGSFARPVATATIAGRGVRLADVLPTDLDATITADRKGLRIESLEARLAGARLEGSGDYAWPGRIEVRFSGQADDIGQVARAFEVTGLPMSGSIHIQGTARGTASSPAVDATASARSVTVDGTDLGDLDATVGLVGDELRMNARAPAAGLRTEATLETNAPFSYVAVAHLERSPVAQLLPSRARGQVPLTDGTISGRLSARGSLRRPLESTVDLDLRGLDLQLADTKIGLDEPATLSLTTDSVATTPLALRIGTGTRVRLSGSLARERTTRSLDLHLEGPLSDLLEAAAPYLPAEPLTAKGMVNLDLRVAGTLDAPEPTGTIAMRAAAIEYGELPPVTDVALDVRLEGAQMVLRSLAATWQKAALHAEGALPLRMVAPAPQPASDAGARSTWGASWLASLREGRQKATLMARVTGITPAVLSPFLSASRLQQIDGTVAATIEAEADAFALARVRASAVLDQAALKLAGVPFAQSVPTRLTLEQGRASVAELRWEAQGNEIRASGSATLTTPKPMLDLSVNGTMDLRILGAFADGLATGGIARADVQITGPHDAPAIVGRIGVTDGELRVDTPALLASDLEGDVRIDERHAATLALSGSINGGDAKLTGNLDLTQPDDPRGRVTLSARRVAMEYPDGFFTESNADLTLTLGSTRPSLAGRVGVLGGTYREPLAVTGGLLANLQRGGLATTARPSSFLSTLDLDVTVATEESVRIDNNYGRLDLAANLQLAGTADQPGVVGRVEAAPGGEIYLAGNVYRVQRLVVDLTSPREIVPVVSFFAETRVGNVPIEIELECDPARPCEQEIRSPGISNEQAEALLFGISGDATATGTQLARLLSGEIFGIVGRSVGLDTLRLEQATSGASDIFDDPTLVAGDVNPASRLTLGKRIGEDVEFAYSQDLANSGFTWSTRYHAPYGTSLRVLLLDDQSRAYEFRHEPTLGASPRTSRATRPRPRIAAVRLAGHLGFTERELRDRLTLTEGDRFEFAAWQRDRDRLQEWYRVHGFLDARIRARRLVAEEPVRQESSPGAASQPGHVGPVTLEYTIERGPLTRLDVRGVALPDDLRDRVRARWSTAVFDGFLERDARAIVREHLYREGRFQAVISATVSLDASTNVKTLTIDVNAGEFLPRRLEISGNNFVATSRLYAAAEQAGSLTAWIDPASLEQAIQGVYQAEGLIAAEIDVPEPEVLNGTSVARVVVREGEPFRVGRVTLEGVPASVGLGTADLPGLASGARYRPLAIREGVLAVEGRLRTAGFLEAHVEVRTAVDAKDRRVDVNVRAEPGARSLLTEVIVDGADPKAPLVARAIALELGAPVDPSAVSQTRRQLYATGEYRSVDIALEPRDAPAGGPQAEGDRAVVARLRLEERPQYRFRYGLALNDDVLGPEERQRRLGFAADLENRNLLGLGTTAGVSARLRRDQQVGRVFLGTNRFFSLPLRSSLFLERSRQTINEDGLAPIVSDETEISAEQAYRVRRDVEVRYGYRLGRNRTVIEGGDFDVRVRIARLSTSALIDRRRNPFDPTGGWFASGTFELSRPGLGSDLSFLRSFLQYYRFQTIREGLVLASAARVGLARTFDDQDLIPSERFFGGGATSARGFREDDLGPRDLFGDAEGGRALLILNQEVRFPVYRWLRGVGFVDVGNVYPTLSDSSLSDLLIGAGAGLRIDTPIGLLRLDLGVPVNPRSFDPRWRLHVGLGHAF